MFAIAEDKSNPYLAASFLHRTDKSKGKQDYIIIKIDLKCFRWTCWPIGKLIISGQFSGAKS